MTYNQTLDYLYSQLPMFQRTGAAAYKPNLDNTIALCNLLENPQTAFKSIHIAGTNGKGSTSHMLASILQEAGLKTGLYTSPHLKDFRERIKINGKEIPKKTVIDFVNKYKEDFEKIRPSFFEMTVGLAFDYFRKERVDIAVIETGLGGRLDSTNIITPLLSVITNISWDHAALLGDTLPKIAAEKAGIIKTGIPVVIGETQPEVKPVFEKKATEYNAPIYFADEEFSVNILDTEVNMQATERSRSGRNNTFKNKPYNSLHILKKEQPFLKIDNPLQGLYQQKNVITLIQATELLRKEFNLTNKHIQDGIKNVLKNTRLQGRWQILSNNPLTICDTGHNEAGIRFVLTQIRQTPHQHLHFVLGMVNDKDVAGILSLLPKNATYYFCRANLPRALDAAILQEQAARFSLKGNTYPSVKTALEKARESASSGDLVFVGGSTFVVAEVV